MTTEAATRTCGGNEDMLWSGLYPSQKHLAWLLCSGIIHGCLAAARGAFHMHSADPVELRPSQCSLRAASKGD